MGLMMEFNILVYLLLLMARFQGKLVGLYSSMGIGRGSERKDPFREIVVPWGSVNP